MWKYLNKKNISDGFWSVVDQGLFAGANFALNIYLANVLNEAAYGQFAIGFTVILFLGGVQAPFIIEPILVFGAGRFKEQLLHYKKKSVIINNVLLALVSLSIIIVASIYNLWFQFDYYYTIIISSLVAPFILYQWLMRRFAYVVKKPAIAAVGNCVYVICLVVILGISYLLELFLLNELNIFILLGICSVFSGLVLSYFLNKQFQNRTKKINYVSVLGRHWHYGKWSFPASLFYWIPLNLPYILLGYFGTSA